MFQAFSDNLEVSNYPMRARTAEELSRVRQVQEEREIEIEEQRVGATILFEKKLCGDQKMQAALNSREALQCREGRVHLQCTGERAGWMYEWTQGRNLQ